MFISKLSTFTKQKNLYWWLVIAGVVLLAAGAAVWWCSVSLRSDRVFWAAVNQSLMTRGVTLEGQQDNGQASMHQMLQISLGGENKAYWRSFVAQQGTQITTEMFGTKTASYSRYVDIKTDSLGQNGKPIDFSSVLDVWSKTPPGQTSPLNQSLLGLSVPLGAMPVPMGNLSSEKRAALVDYMHKNKVYQVDFGKVTKTKKDGRRLYTYDVTMTTEHYAHVLKQFAKDVGLHDFDQLDPSAFKSSPPITVKITIDARAHHIVRVEVPESSYTQTFTSYDIAVAMREPTDAISSDEMQKRLYELH